MNEIIIWTENKKLVEVIREELIFCKIIAVASYRDFEINYHKKIKGFFIDTTKVENISFVDKLNCPVVVLTKTKFYAKKILFLKIKKIIINNESNHKIAQHLQRSFNLPKT